MMILLMVFAIVFVLMFATYLVITTVLVMERHYAYRIISGQENIIREYEERIMKLEEGETQNGRNDSSDYYETARRT